MKEFVYQGSREDEERIRETLERAVKEIVDRVGTPGLEAVVLTGGFGRGEGSLKKDKGSPRLPFNDFDFLLVGTKPRIDSGVLSGLRSSLPRLLGVDFVDLGYVRSSGFRKAEPTIFLYDLRNGSKILWGSPDALQNVPPFSSSDLPLTEATRLFLNRGIGLLYTFLLFERGETDSVLKKNAAVAWSKTVLAAGDAILLQRRLFHWSYAERIKRIEEVARLSVLDGDFLNTYRSACLFKLTADFGVLPTQNPVELCLDAKSLHEKYFGWVEQKRTFVHVTDWTEYPLLLVRVGLQPLRRRLKDSLKEVASVRVHVERLARYVRLPLWGEERRLGLLPLVLYSVREPGGTAVETVYLETACMFEFGRKSVGVQDWTLLARTLVGESHP